MAGDWIPIRLDIADDPAVIAIGEITGLHVDTVVGKLHRLWSWANRHLENGNARSVTKNWVNTHLAVTGFAEAMVEAGWLKVTDKGIQFPNFDNWNSQSAKQRVLASKRVQKHRADSCNGDSVTKPLPEKRREEKRTEEKRREKTEEKVTPLSGGTVLLVKFPPELDTPEFRAAWERWKHDRRARRVKAFTPDGEATQLKKLVPIGPVQAINCIEASIAAGYQGLFPDKFARGQGSDLITTMTNNLNEFINRGQPDDA